MHQEIAKDQLERSRSQAVPDRHQIRPSLGECCGHVQLYISQSNLFTVAGIWYLSSLFTRNPRLTIKGV
jgi:hypothetical protein